jgi:hypothetical protein
VKTSLGGHGGRNGSHRYKLSQEGIKIFTVHEETGHTDLALTKEQGASHGANALEQAERVGQPKGTAIYFALEGLPDGYRHADLPGIRKYFEGVKASIGDKYKLGVYSDGVVCSTLLTEGICAYTWLSASMAFEGTREFYQGGRWNLAQKTPLDQTWGDLSVDVNEAKADFGAFAVPIGVA